MPRPRKRTVDYFPHFVQHGRTLLILQNEFGNDGYAFWFKLLGLLCKTEGQVYDYNNPAAWRLLLAETSVTEDIANKVLTLLAEITAIDTELFTKKIIWVQHLVDNLESVYSRRDGGVVPSRPVIVDNNPVNVDINPHSRVNKSKQEETKQESKEPLKNKLGQFSNVLLSDDDLNKLKDKFGEDGTKQRIEKLSEGIASKGYKYKSHYATILNWARRDGENKGAQDGKYKGNPSQKPAGAFDGLE